MLRITLNLRLLRVPLFLVYSLLLSILEVRHESSFTHSKFWLRDQRCHPKSFLLEVQDTLFLQRCQFLHFRPWYRKDFGLKFLIQSLNSALMQYCETFNSLAVSATDILCLYG